MNIDKNSKKNVKMLSRNRSISSTSIKKRSKTQPSSFHKVVSRRQSKMKNKSIGASIISFSLILGPLLYNSSILNPTSTADKSYMKILKIMNGHKNRDEFYFKGLFSKVYPNYPDFQKTFRGIFPESDKYDPLFQSLFNEISILQFTFFLPSICLILHKKKVISKEQYNYIYGKYRKLVNAILIAEASDVEEKDIITVDNDDSKGGGNMSILIIFIFMIITFHSTIVSADTFVETVGAIVTVNIKRDVLKKRYDDYIEDLAPIAKMSSFHKAISNMISGKSSELIGDIRKIYTGIQQINIHDLPELITHLGFDTATILLPTVVKTIPMKNSKISGLSNLKYVKDKETYEITLMPRNLNDVVLKISPKNVLDLISKFDQDKLFHMVTDMIKSPDNTKAIQNEFFKSLECSFHRMDCITDIQSNLILYMNELYSVLSTTGSEMSYNMGRLFNIIDDSFILIVEDAIKYPILYNNILNTFYSYANPNKISSFPFSYLLGSVTALSYFPLVNENSEDNSNPYFKINIMATEFNNIMKQTEFILKTILTNLGENLTDKEKKFVNDSIVMMHSITTMEELIDPDARSKFNISFHNYIDVISNPTYKSLCNKLETITNSENI